jgi:peptide/nickel transport system substrate-binding protein
MINAMSRTSNPMMNKFLLLASAACALFFTACGGGATSESDVAGDPVAGDWIVIHQLSDPHGINPYVTSDAGASAMADRVFQKLLGQDFLTTDLYPVLADARPLVSDDHLTYTFTLKQGIAFSDGKPLTASDVVFSFKAIANPLIADAAALRNYYESVKDVVATTPSTVVITMSQPYFLAEYFLGSLWIMPKHVLDPKGLTDKYTFAETKSIDAAQANPAMKEFAEWYGSEEVRRDPKLNIGSGPYAYEEWKTGESVTLRRNDAFWAKGKDAWNPAYADKLVYKVINDRNSAVLALKNAEIDFMEYVPPTKYTEEIDTVATPHLRKYPFQTQAYSYIGFNMARPILSDVNVRKAIAHCVDRDALIKQLVRGLATTVNSPIYQDRPEYDKSLPNIAYDPNTAKSLLAQAGWADANGDGVLDKAINGKNTPLTVTMLINAGNELREALAVNLSEELRKIGIKMEIRKLEWSVFQENQKARQFDLYIGGWINDPIPSDPYQIWHSSQAKNRGSNYVSFMNPRVDQLLEMNRVEFDEQKRTAYMKEFQQIIAREQPYVFLWSPLYPAVYNRRLQNVKFSSVRPGYNPPQWWVPAGQWKYVQAQ